ncbi:hypothetical protein BDQ17DRAFT_1351698 [Cyathus striatus]|nr:hypothetical protein BDQ17DRAFT_1351698 [Cyathus striatus]
MATPLPTNVILYRYDTSPFSHKIDNILVLKNIPHYQVVVSPMLPRPEITDLLGINYRRIPILSIGNDVYCDTSLIATTLERKFPSSNGFGTLFPMGKHGRSADTGLIKTFSKFYADNALFPLLVSLLPWDQLPAPFLEDRSALIGGPIDVKAFIANQGKNLSLLSVHLSLVEEQLSDDREWLFDTELPGLADISVHFMLSWAKGFKSTHSVLDAGSFPFTGKWISRLSSFLQSKQDIQHARMKLSGVDAAKVIFSASRESDPPGFDIVQAEKLGLQQGEDVFVAPEDTGMSFRE